MKIRKVWKLIIAILLCQLAGIIGSLFTSSSVTGWYATINKASFNPPSWIFGPVWTILFIMMGVSLYLIWIKKVKSRTSYIWFGIQLLLNTLWSILFFGLESPLFAFIEIVLLWIAILMTILSFRRISKTASYFLIPYLLWVTFAAVLNLSIVLLN